MKPTYDTDVREQVRQRMSPPKRESVAEIARSTGITAQTLYNWRSQCQKQGQLVPATTKPPKQWGAADKLATVIQVAGLSGPDLGAFCRERGLYPRQPTGGRPLRMPMAPVLRAWLISGNFSAKITIRLA